MPWARKSQQFLRLSMRNRGKPVWPVRNWTDSSIFFFGWSADQRMCRPWAESPSSSRFFLEDRRRLCSQSSKEYEPGTLQTYRNGLRRFFLERPCPPAVDNFNLEKSSAIYIEFQRCYPWRKKDLKQKGLGNKQNAAQPVETEDT